MAYLCNCAVSVRLRPRLPVIRQRAGPIETVFFKFKSDEENGGAMGKRLWIAFAAVSFGAGAASAQDAKTVLQTAQKAMGDVTSIQYSGTGHLNSFGQAWVPNAAWPVTNLTSYTKTIDYSSKSAKEDLIHSEPTPMVKGGGRPFAGDDH